MAADEGGQAPEDELLVLVPVPVALRIIAARLRNMEKSLSSIDKRLTAGMIRASVYGGLATILLTGLVYAFARRFIG